MLIEGIRSFHKSQSNKAKGVASLTESALQVKLGLSAKIEVSEPKHVGFGRYQFGVSIRIADSPELDLDFSAFLDEELRLSPHGGERTFKTLGSHHLDEILKDYIRFRLTGEQSNYGFTEDHD